MYGNVDAALLRIRLLAGYLVNKCNLKRIRVDFYIFFRKYDKMKFKLVMSVCVDNLIMVGKPETLQNIKEKIKEKINISESGIVKNFPGVYFE